MTTFQSLPEELREQLLASGQLTTQQFAGEQPANLERALPRAIEVVLSSLAELVGRPAGREQVYQLSQEAHNAEAGFETGTVATHPGAGLVKNVTEDRYHGTVHGITTASNLRPAAVGQLFDVVTAAALERLGSLAAEHHWDAQQLSQWMRPHRPEPTAVPFDTTPAATTAPVDTPSGASWFANRSNVWLLAVSFIAVAELGYILGHHSIENDAATVATTSATGPAATDVGTTQPSSGRAYKSIPVANLTSTRPVNPNTVPVPVVLKLKDGVRQVIGATSTESKLYQFLVDPSKNIDAEDPSKEWIGFDRIYFDSNKATLTNESLWQLSNVASILKRFPASKIKIGGYTDNSGHPFTNLQLSKARAEAAREALVSLGVPGDRLVAVGYGQLDNIASNDTEEGRAVNRRVSMQVTQK